MSKFAIAAAFALAMTTSAPAGALTLEVISGTGQRALNLRTAGATGQSFIAVDTNLTSFGFQFVALNPTLENLPFTFQLFAGETLTGTAITTRTFNVPTAVNGRTAQWVDIDITGTAVAKGQTYTAVLSGDSLRNGLVVGPNINLSTGVELSGDAYADGQALFTNAQFANCARSGNCDLNFRVAGTTLAAAVPEPSSWALLIGGFGMAGGTLRRRAKVRTTAACS